MNSFFKLPVFAAVLYMLASLLKRSFFYYYVIGEVSPEYKTINFVLEGLSNFVNHSFFYSLCLCFVVIFIFYCHRIYQCSLKNICLLILITIVVTLSEYAIYRTSTIRFEFFISTFFILISLWYGLFILLRRFFDTTKEDFPFTAKQIQRIHCHFYCFLYAAFIVAITYFYVLPSNRGHMQDSPYQIVKILFNFLTIIQFVICYVLLFSITKSLFSDKFSSLQLKRLFKSVGWSACFNYLAQMVAILIFVLISPLFFVENYYKPSLNEGAIFPVFIFCIVLIVLFVKINRSAVRRYFSDHDDTSE